MNRQLFIVDDDEVIRLLLESHFRTRGFTCQQAIAPIRTAIVNHTNHITNLITDLLCTLQDGFRKAKFRAALRVAWDTISKSFIKKINDHIDPPTEFKQLITTTFYYKPG